MAYADLKIKREGVADAVSKSRPSRDATAVTPHDSTELDPYATQIYVGNGGDVKVTTVEGTELTFVGVPSGTIIPVSVKLVWSTGTTAQNIVSLHD